MGSPRKHPDTSSLLVQPSSPRHATPSTAFSAGANRKIGIAVDLSDESALAVQWAVQNYLRSGDSVVLLHVSPTSVLYGADWGAIGESLTTDGDFDAFTASKANELGKTLVESNIPFKIHIVKDHDMKERLCLEVERLGLSAVIMGSRGFGALGRKGVKGRLGSVSDYCVHHCVCPVIVVRSPEKDTDAVTELGACPVVPEEEPEYHDASDKQTDTEKSP